VLSQPSDPIRGDLVEITWVDILEDATGDPDKSDLCQRVSIGWVWGQKQSHGMECLVTTTTRDHDGASQQGYCIYPRSCVLAMKVIKRASRARRKK
jgi:hypothetical protein